MRILGISGEGYKKSFIVEISDTELSYLIGVYYSKEIPQLNKKVSDLKSGDEINVSNLKSMADDLFRASEKFIEASKAFSSTNNTMLKFASIIVDNNNKTDA